MNDPTYNFATTPIADKNAVVQNDKFRFTVLTEGLIRLEWAEDGVFEDRATTFAINRALPVPKFKVNDGSVLEIVTDRFRLVYDRQTFSPEGLSVTSVGNLSNYRSQWRYSVPMGNLGGTISTLDMIDGRTPLGDGILAKEGIAVIDDSKSFLLVNNWFAPRRTGVKDLYVFAYGRDYLAALKAFYQISGPQPVIPRWAFGNWWARYYAYSDKEYLALLDRFEKEKLPFSVGILDMDWHRVEDVPEKYGSGWTGYSWNRELFPDPKGLLEKVKAKGLRVAFNDHPADGLRAFEDSYKEAATEFGIDPDTEEPIQFDFCDPKFVKIYFKYCHQPLEELGADFWWIDWQQGSHSRVKGVDPLFLLNHFNYLDNGRNNKHKMTFSRYAGPGSQRYPIGFAGDALITWDSLAFQAEFTATASNTGYGMWSCDIGGHLRGIRDDELATRWLQLGVFQPINRLHSTSSNFIRREPWAYPLEARTAMGDALRFRHRLVPYLFSMCHRAHTDGVPICQPMYYHHPMEPRCYPSGLHGQKFNPNQFYFGSELVVSPVVTRTDTVTLRGKSTAYLPPGGWIDIFAGYCYEGDTEVGLHRTLESIPVLLKSGGILPLDATEALDATVSPGHIELVIAAGADGRFDLIEDEGTTQIAFQEGVITIKPGAESIKRKWTISVIGSGDKLTATLDGRELSTQEHNFGTCFVGVSTLKNAPTEIKISGLREIQTANYSEVVYDVLNKAQFEHVGKEEVWSIFNSETLIQAKTGALATKNLPESLFSVLLELLSLKH